MLGRLRRNYHQLCRNSTEDHGLRAHIREPVSALGYSPSFDDIDPDCTLTRNHIGDHVAQVGIVCPAWPFGAFGAWQATDMGRENRAALAPLHCPTTHA